MAILYSILYIILLVLILGVIILIHELGHFYFAKKYGVYIFEFSIGMGPVIYSKLGKDNIQYNLRAIPIGGFVSMAGEVYEDDDTKSVPKEDFMCNKKWYQRFNIIIAGVVMNFILALVILSVLGMFGAQTVVPVIESVLEDSAAEDYGLVAGDTVLEINGTKLSSWDVATILIYTDKYDGEFTFKLERENGDVEDIVIVPDYQEAKDGTLNPVFGINLEQEMSSGFFGGISYAFNKTWSILQSMILTLGGLFTGNLDLNSLSGPIGMYNVVESAAQTNVLNLVYLIAFLSINVGFLNIMPFPAFDGGRLLFMIIEKIKGSPVDAKFENTCHTIGFFLLLALSIYVAFNDIIRFF